MNSDQKIMFKPVQRLKTMCVANKKSIYSEETKCQSHDKPSQFRSSTKGTHQLKARWKY